VSKIIRVVCDRKKEDICKLNIYEKRIKLSDILKEITRLMTRYNLGTCDKVILVFEDNLEIDITKELIPLLRERYGEPVYDRHNLEMEKAVKQYYAGNHEALGRLTNNIRGQR